MENVIIEDARVKHTITLPATKGTVEVYEDILGGDIKQLEETKEGMERNLSMLLKFISSWNFVDKEQNALPLTLESLYKLPASDLEFLTKETMEFAQKKKEVASPEKS